MPGIVQPVSIVQIVRSLSDISDIVISKSGLNIYHFGADDFGGSLNNNGSLWFNATGGPGTFRADFKNISDRTLTKINYSFEGITEGMAPISGYAFNSGGWVTGESITIPDGTFTSPSVVWSPDLELPSPVSPNGNASMSLVMGSGWWPGGKYFGNDVWPESQHITSPLFLEGDYLTGGGSGFLPIGPLHNRIIGQFDGDPIVWWGWFGDSTAAMVRPIDATNNVSKEGVWHFANVAAISANHNVRSTSYGQGGASWNDIQARVRAHIPYFTGKINVVAVMVWTWNAPPGSVEQANTNWAEWLTLKSEIESFGLDAVPYILNPPTTRNSSGQIEGYNALHGLVIETGGLVFDDLVADGTDIIAAYSEDNIHLNRDGGFIQGTLGENRIYNKSIDLGFSV